MEFLLILSVLGCFIRIPFNCEAAASPCHLSDTDLPTLHKHLSDSHHTPVCVLVRKRGSTLEKRLVRLMTDDNLQLKSWRFVAVNAIQVTDLPRYLMQESSSLQTPRLRCFLGPLLSFDYEKPQQSTSKHLQQWLAHLVKKHHQLSTGSVSTIRAAADSHHFTLVVFPTAQQHTELEEVAFQVGRAISRETSVEVIVVHPSSPNFRDVTVEFQVNMFPAILLIEKDPDDEPKQTVFLVHDLLTNRLETHMRARLIPAVHLADNTFESEVLEVKTSALYRPYVVGFYAWWEKDVSTFLSFLRQAVLDIGEMEASLRFGLVDVASNPNILPQFMSAECLKHLPFIAIFQRVQGTSNVKQSELQLKRPSTFSLYTAMQQEGLILMDRERKTISFAPYGHTDPTHVCMAWEGPHGYACSVSSNVSYAELGLPGKVPAACKQEPVPLLVQKKLGDITVLTASDWDSVTQVSSAQNKSLGEPTPSAVKLSLVIFIRQSCRSCEQNLPTFQLLHQELNGSVSLYFVNCSQESSICEQHHMTGFPTILAFRTYLTPSSAGACTEAPSITARQGYHGVLTVKAILDWVRTVSRDAVAHLQFQKPKWQGESTRLMATLMPRDSGYLPLPPGKNKGYFYTVDCLQVLCERLCGLAQCFTVYSTEIPASEYQHKDLTMVVTKVVFERHDGATVTIMELGKSLSALLEMETRDTLHMFHQPQSYKLRPKQKCEEDHGYCTKFLEDFTRDHLRLPVTHLTSEIFHTRNNPLLSEKKPILLALAEPENLTASAPFLQVLERVAGALYKDVVVATLDVAMFQAWAGAFVPRNYNKKQAVLDSWGELGIYPRFCMFLWEDHTQAAFYPSSREKESSSKSTHTSSLPSSSSWSEDVGSVESIETEASSAQDNPFKVDAIIQFARSFLQDPSKHLIPTERF